MPSLPSPPGAGERSPQPDGEALPESRDEGRDTEVGPSETEPLRDDFRDPAEDLDLDRGGRMAGGGKGGGSCGKIMFLSPPGTLDLGVCGP